MFKEIKISTSKKNEMIDITSSVEKVVNASGSDSGICVVYVPHTTAGIVIQENADSNVQKDLLNALEAMIPKINFSHAEGNSDAHLKSVLVGKEKTLVVEKFSLKLGKWDAIYFAEFDGPRERTFYVKVVEG
jgi:secondary thiamine-phosphate synthase enzyme